MGALCDRTTPPGVFLFVVKILRVLYNIKIMEKGAEKPAQPVTAETFLRIASDYFGLADDTAPLELESYLVEFEADTMDVMTLIIDCEEAFGILVNEEELETVIFGRRRGLLEHDLPPIREDLKLSDLIGFLQKMRGITT
jgi:acyl carrier protein